MRIVVNARYLRSRYENRYGQFQYETLKRVVQNHPEDVFIFLFDKPFDANLSFTPNVTLLYIKPEAKSPMSWKWWFDFKIPAILRKYKADVFVSMDGFLSMRTKLPQCAVLQDLSYLHTPAVFKKSHLDFFKKNIPLFLHKAASVAVAGASIKKDSKEHFKIPDEKLNIVYSGATALFRPSKEEMNGATKEKYSSGYNYFIYTGFLEKSSNLIILLKAFSIFKKRQKSSWKLVLAGTFIGTYKEEFLKSLASYKYREDVILLDTLSEEERAAILSAAYAMVYPVAYEGFAVPVLEAMQCKVPVIVSTGQSLQDITGEAALCADISNPADVADKMMQLYKDETLRSRLIAKGDGMATRYSWDKTADLLWESIHKAAK